MAPSIENSFRDQLITAFRSRLCDKLQITPFPHQAGWWSAADGQVMLDVTETDPDAPGVNVKLSDGTIERRSLIPRQGGRARVIADLGAFKIGKSFSSALWTAAFACIPNARVQLVGLEYDICAPEFEYICEFLLSDRGMGMKADSVQNRPRDGRMWLDIAETGARFEAKSWERKDTMKGKEIDCLTGEAPIWMGDFSFKPIKDVQVGDVVIGWGNQRRARNGVLPKTIRKGLKRTRVLGIHRKMDTVWRLTLESGKEIECTPTHRWLSDATNCKFPKPKVGRTLCHVIDIPRTLSTDEQFTAGWLAGIYDGEGHRNQICQSLAVNPEVFGRIEENLTALGFEHGRVSGGTTGVEWHGGRQAALNFLHFTRSTRFLRHADEYILGGRCIDFRDKIIKIEDVGEKEVYCLQTEDETYIAHGYVSHNCYLYCEAYMLPGLECYTSFSQNLRARNGYAIFATTPDRPWVQEIHNAAHSGMKEFEAWHCTCGVHSSQNPYTFDQGAMDRDRNLMTREKFQIHYEGKLGDFVGRVYNYQRGERTFTPNSHPLLFSGGQDRSNLRVPDGWKLESGADTGTFSSALTVAFSPDGDAFVLDEFPNYRYVAGTPELDETVTIPTWAGTVAKTIVQLGGQAFAWADKNSQFKREVQNYGLHLESNTTPLEARTEIAREYFKQNKVWFAPWLQVLPFELENASWPEEASASGKFARIKDRDHTLDCLEHILSRRPRGKGTSAESQRKLWIEQFTGRSLTQRGHVDPHLGRW